MTDTITLTREELGKVKEGIKTCKWFFVYSPRHCEVDAQWEFCPICKKLTEFAKGGEDAP